MTTEDMTVEELAAAFRELPDVEVRTRKPRAQDDGSQDQLDVAGKARGVVDDRVRTKHQARLFAFAAVRSGRRDWPGLCLQFVRTCFGVDPLYPDAITAWRERAGGFSINVEAHQVPNAKPVYFGGSEHGHVAFSIGDGRCISTDIDPDEPGAANVCRIDAICSAWGMTLLGWADDINGEDVPAPRPRRRRVPDRLWRRKMLRRAIVNSRRAGNHVRTARLRRWLDSLG